MHRHLWKSLTAALTLALGGAAHAAEAPDVLHHELQVQLKPTTHEIGVRARIELPDSWRTEEPVVFRLHGGLKVNSMAGDIVVAPREGPSTRSEVEDAEEVGQKLAVREWVVRPTGGAWPSPTVLDLAIHGKIHHPLVEEEQEYARSFSRTSGTISEEGVFLSGGSWWLPRFGDELITFRMDVNVPPGWNVVSQGERVSQGRIHAGPESVHSVRWDCPHPMDEAYVIAAQFTEYSRQAGDVTAQAFLRTPDENLATKYLEATAQYIEMYRKLIGPYPFAKFALVENFWETGYGMPSFTLLGPKVIRFPFILHSSYPHEILHNWWGNSVFVDWETGNWCEGLTAYMADHLIREGQGRGAEYRRDSLKGFRSYVNEGRDFPLTEFRSRHSSATQAIGYGKCLFVFHMLRMRFGDQAFARSLQTFYRQQRFKRAAWADVRAAFEQVTKEDLGDFFAQWVERPGAPDLAVGVATDDAGKLHVSIRQTHDGEPFALDVPVAVTRAGGAEAEWHVLSTDGRASKHTLEIADAVRVDVDPRFDVFRRLDVSETPPTLAEMFGAERVLIVVPEGDDEMAQAWRGLADAWGGENVEVSHDGALWEVFPPPGVSTWLVGSGNRLAGEVLAGVKEHGVAVNDDEVRFGVESVPAAGHSFVMVSRSSTDGDQTVGWIGSDRADAIPGLARKLPHYGKYSYLAFEGAAPDNVVKGQWPATGSPLVAYVGEGTETRPDMGTLPKREPLARLAPVFDPARMRADVEWMAHDDRDGRGVGTDGHAATADWIAQQMRDAGLQPGGANKTWFHAWTEENGPGGESVSLGNVVGIIPGTDPDLYGQSVVVSAHFDHLGRGFPEARKGHEGKIHNGADDNASGVAVMLEVARLLAKDLKPARTIVFVAFDGEEWGLKGSRRYIADNQMWPVDKVHSMVNLDTVGRLGDQKLLVLGSGTATEWRHIAMGVGFTTGVESTCVSDDPGGSDQVVFHEHGVPAVQLFTGPHEDYHRSTDTADKVDYDGLVKVATWLRETVVYLSMRKEPLTSTLGGAEKPEAPADRPREGRRVSLGTMPDFAFAGPGVKVASVIAGSPAEKAGIQAGDIVMAVDGTEMTDLRAYGAALRTKAPGDVITVKVKRGDEEIEVKATLIAR
jgi:hypothetical protein